MAAAVDTFGAKLAHFITIVFSEHAKNGISSDA